MRHMWGARTKSDYTPWYTASYTEYGVEHITKLVTKHASLQPWNTAGTRDTNVHECVTKTYAHPAHHATHCGTQPWNTAHPRASDKVVEID